MSEKNIYSNARILLVDDTPELLDIMENALTYLGAEIVRAEDGEEALMELQKGLFDLIISDYLLPHANGMEILSISQKIKPHPPAFILVTGKGTIDLAVEAMQNGARHFIEKPFKIPVFIDRVRGVLDTVELSAENRKLRQAVESRYIFSEIIGSSKRLHDVLDLALRASEQSSPVLLLGESGTGKDLFARAIHFHSPRQRRPFIPINCGAIPANLIESEFFGHKKGAFTGAIADRPGCFEEASGGTLFLDEIGEMPLDMQVKLLRVLEEHKIRRIGENREISVDFRIIAATNRPLHELVQQKQFRQDLFYRLNVLNIPLPPLRTRRDDVVPLSEHILKQARKDNQTQVKSISPDAMEILQSYDYPGNVRELVNILHRAFLLCDTDRLEPAHLPPELHGQELYQSQPFTAMPPQAASEEPVEEEPLNLKEATRIAQEKVERRLIPRAISEAEGNYKKAAEMLGISRGSLYVKLEKFDLPKNGARRRKEALSISSAPEEP